MSRQLASERAFMRILPMAVPEGKAQMGLPLSPSPVLRHLREGSARMDRRNSARIKEVARQLRIDVRRGHTAVDAENINGGRRQALDTCCTAVVADRGWGTRKDSAECGGIPGMYRTKVSRSVS